MRERTGVRRGRGDATGAARMSWTERRPGERGGPMVEKHGEEGGRPAGGGEQGGVAGRRDWRGSTAGGGQVVAGAEAEQGAAAPAGEEGAEDGHRETGGEE